MLLFIHSATTQAIKNVTFQYISCYCLSCIEHKYNKMSDNFNTSHVTVYRILPNVDIPGTSISIHLMLLFILSPSLDSSDFLNFNTSHVTVYQEQKYEEEQDAIFQYISCYCLSYLIDKHRK